MEPGFYTFADVMPSPQTEETISPAQRLRNLVEEIELADQVGLDVFGVGEHHRPEYAISVPAVVLAAAAERTRKIRLTSAVTVLSSDDPVRVFQQFATLDLLSGGRAEIMAGRGSFIESFPLFGYDLDDYEQLFEEVIEKILFQHEIFGHQRFLMQSSVGAMPHHKILHAIELFGTRVAPVVRRETAHAPAPTEPMVDTRP